MRASLHFKLPEEEEDHLTALKATQFKSTLRELDEFLRQKIKYTEETSITFEALREKLHEIEKENEVYDLL